MSHPRRLFSRRFPTSSFFCAWRRRLSVRLHCSLVLLAMRIIFVLNILLLWRHAWARPAMSMDWSLPEEDFMPTSPKISATDRPTSSLAPPTSTKSPSETASASGSVASDSFPLDGQRIKVEIGAGDMPCQTRKPLSRISPFLVCDLLTYVATQKYHPAPRGRPFWVGCPPMPKLPTKENSAIFHLKWLGKKTSGPNSIPDILGRVGLP